MNLFKLFVVLIISHLALSAGAHEFWLQPDKFIVASGASVKVEIRVGENFSGSVRSFVADRVALLRHYSASGIKDEFARVPPSGENSCVPFTFSGSGTHLIAVDSKPNAITLPAERFHAYLLAEGLDHIISLRRNSGQEDFPGRERYLRCVKTLVRVGNRSDNIFAARTGQRLEIVPQSDPLAAHAGNQVRFVTFFDDRPLPGALIQAWHRRDHDRLHVVKLRTDSDGGISLDLPYAGPWMISVVHMISLNDRLWDWESYWGSLTFAVQP